MNWSLTGVSDIALSGKVINALGLAQALGRFGADVTQRAWNALSKACYARTWT